MAERWRIDPYGEKKGFACFSYAFDIAPSVLAIDGAVKLFQPKALRIHINQTLFSKEAVKTDKAR